MASTAAQGKYSMKFAGRPLPAAPACWLPMLLSLLACGYHRTGAVTTLPSNVRTIAIPGFDSQSTTYKVEQTLTAAVVREFLTRTHYHVINNTSDDADATLKGTVAAVYA